MGQTGGKLDGWLPAVCLHRALGAASRWRRRFPGAGGKDVGVTVEVVGKDGQDSSRNLVAEIPFLDKMVKVADNVP